MPNTLTNQILKVNIMNYYLLTFSRTFHYLLIENNFKSLYRRIIAIKKSLFIPKNVYSFCLIIWFGNFSANSFYGYDLISSVWISFSKKEQCRKIRDIVTVLKSEGPNYNEPLIPQKMGGQCIL